MSTIILYYYYKLKNQELLRKTNTHPFTYIISQLFILKYAKKISSLAIAQFAIILIFSQVIISNENNSSFIPLFQTNNQIAQNNEPEQQQAKTGTSQQNQKEVFPKLDSISNEEQISIDFVYVILGIALGSNAILILIVIRIMNRESKQKLRYQKFATIGELSARLSHDLRSPLSTINLMVSMLKMKNKDPELDEQYQIILNSIKRMKNQLDDVLSHVRKNNLTKKDTSFQKIINQSIEEIVIPNNVEVHLPDNDVSVYCDDFKVQSVITNLINNAIQSFEKNPGQIKLMVDEDPNNVICQIQDSGPGIKKENISKIFQPTFSTKQTGTGLGLSICKTIIEKHGGKISVSTKPTTFTISIPKIKMQSPSTTKNHKIKTLTNKLITESNENIMST